MNHTYKYKYKKKKSLSMWIQKFNFLGTYETFRHCCKLCIQNIKISRLVIFKLKWHLCICGTNYRKMGVTLFFRKCFQHYISRYASILISYTDVFLNTALENSPICLTFRHRASCIYGQAFHYSSENAFYIFNQQIYFIIWYLLDGASLI